MNDKKSEHEGIKVVAQNKSARRDYAISDILETGVVLKGSEVKSIRDGEVNLKESYVRFKQDELYLIGCHVNPYKYSREDELDATRDRKLLLHRREMRRLQDQIKLKGFTLVPLRFYFKNGRCKLEIGVGKGKKLFDKRADIKDRESKIYTARVIAARMK